MKTRGLATLAFIVIFILAIIGCSGGGATPVSPEMTVADILPGASSHQNWGVWQFTADPVAGTMDIVPIRAASMHVNVLPFLEPPALTNLTLEYLKFDGNQITADIGLRHPFLGLMQFTGFDVCGILITSGSVTGFDDPGLTMAGDGDTRLLNPDGYTRWWNPPEFPVNQGTMFSYNDGLLGTPDTVGHYTSTLNGYKYYADGLDTDAGLDTVVPAKRGVFSAGQKNIRRFIIQMDAGLVFNYAVDANWQFPMGGAPWEVPADFGPEANRPEAWRIDTTETFNTLWNNGNSSGGLLSLSIDVYDHFNADMNTVKVESPGSFDIVASGTAIGGGAGYSTYAIDIVDATPSAGSISMLITIECEKEGYGGLLPGKTQAAYFMATAQVGGEPPIEGIYVDGDNIGDPAEDGTMDHPFDTIQEGINAAGTGDYIDIWDIYVDIFDAGDYAIFTLKDDVQLHGLPWHGGSGKPEVPITQAWTIGNGVDNATVENFQFTFNHTSQVDDTLKLLSATSCGYLTFEDCKFTGIMSARESTFICFTYCTYLTLEHNEFISIRNKSTYATYYHMLLLMELASDDDVLIRHNEFHDIGYDDEGTSTTVNDTNTYLFIMYYAGSGAPPDYCERVQFYNNLIYDITNYSDTDDAAVNYTTILGWSAWVGYNAITGFVWANNTADDITEIADDETKRGNAFFCYGGVIDPNWIVKNSIVSNMAPLSTAIYYNGHRGFWADSCVQQVACTYCNCYNFGPVGHPQVWDYVNFFTKGVGSYGLDQYQDPNYDMTPGDNFYHVQNSALLSDDSSEMGAFGGPDGDWLPPSQE